MNNGVERMLDMASKPLIMVIDDEKMVADTITRIIAGTNQYQTTTVYSAREAFEQLEKNKTSSGDFQNLIRCITLDIKMPDMDGLLFLEELKTRYGKKIGVITISAWYDEKKWKKAAQGLVAGNIKKPFDRNDLLKHLDDFFEERGECMIIQRQILL